MNSLGENTPMVLIVKSLYFEKGSGKPNGNKFKQKYFSANVFAMSLEKDIEERKPEGF